MQAKYKKRVREQLDTTLKHFDYLKTFQSPPKGWIQAIRNALGMTGEQLARRLRVNKQRVSRIEHDEKRGKLTLETIQKVSQALDCIFVYGFLPRVSLTHTVQKQAMKLAKKRMARTNQTMRLEKQELEESEKEKSFKELVEDIINEMPKSLWDIHD